MKGRVGAKGLFMGPDSVSVNQGAKAVKMSRSGRAGEVGTHKSRARAAFSDNDAALYILLVYISHMYTRVGFPST